MRRSRAFVIPTVSHWREEPNSFHRIAKKRGGTQRRTRYRVSNSTFPSRTYVLSCAFTPRRITQSYATVCRMNRAFFSSHRLYYYANFFPLPAVSAAFNGKILSNARELAYMRNRTRLRSLSFRKRHVKRPTGIRYLSDAEPRRTRKDKSSSAMRN